MTSRTLGIAILTALLAFPPSIFADSITWQGGDPGGPNYSIADNWNCATCSPSSVVPSNGNLGLNFDVSVTLSGADVLLDTPATVNSLSLGGSGTATLEATSSGVGITLGTPSSSGNALAVSIGGVLNINSGGSAAIDFSGGAGALNSSGGQINVTDGGTLTLQNSLTSAGTLTDNGTIGVMGSAQSATLMLDDTGNPGSTFKLSGSGTLTLSGLGQISGVNGDEILVNDTGHNITGDGTISNLNLTNNGNITASTGNLILDVTAGNALTNGGSLTVASGQTLTIQNTGTSGTTITDTGTINLNPAASAATSLVFNGNGNPNTFTLSGAGTLNMNGDGSSVSGSFGIESLINDTGHTISGSGTISGLALTNNGTITASGGNLILDVSGTGSLTNTSSLNVSDGSTLTIQNLSASGTTITNTGTINLNASANQTALVLNDGGAGTTFTLSGSGGVLNMTDNAHNLITSGTGGESLINDTGHTIQGSGTISNFTNFTNNGSLISNGAAGMTLDLTNVSTSTGNPDTFTNNGTVNVQNGSALTISSTGGTSIDNEGSIYLGTKSTSGSLVLSDSQAGATDVLTTAGFGELKMSDNSANSISGLTGTQTLVNDTFHTIEGAGTISVANFTNNGTLQSKYSDNALIVSGNLTNWDGTTNTLTGGNYIAGHGSTMQLSSIGSSGIQNISGANIAVYGSSTITGDGSTNAITGANGVNNIYSGATGTGNLLLGWVPGTVTLGTNSSGVFNVSADDNNSIYASGSFPGGGVASLELSGTTAVIGGDLMNSATTSNPGGFASSGVILDHGSSLTVNNLTNIASTSDNFDSAQAVVQLTQGSTLNVNGNVNNSSVPLVSFSGPEDPEASISLDGKSVLNVNNGGAFNNTGSVLALTNSSTANIAGLFTNDFFSLVTLDQANGGTTPSGSILNANGGFSNAGEIDLNNLSTLNNTGAFNNTGIIFLEGSTLQTFDTKGATGSGSFTNDGSLGFSGGFLSVDSGSTLTVSGAFSNVNGASLSITDNSTASVTGLFTNDCISSVVLDGTPVSEGGGFEKTGQQHSGILASPGASLTTYNGFSNAGLVSLNVNSELSNTGLFHNSYTGLVTVDNASDLTNTGTFHNSGTVMTGQTAGGNTINVTGALFNTSAGMIELTGQGDSMTVTGHFINSGAVSLSGDSASFSSDGLDNKSGATITLSADKNSASSTSWASNKGTIMFSGTNGQVASAQDFTNASTGVITMAGSGDQLFTTGSANIYNAGMVTIGDGETVTAGGDYTQTAGTTTIAAGGNLGAVLFDLQGGLLTGGGTIEGNLTVDGGTLNPGDPQSFNVIGNYVETSSGILDLDFADFGDPDLGDYDQVNVTGSVSLGGTLDLTLEPGFDATLGTMFDIINWTVGSTPGDFATFNDVAFDNNTRTFAEVFNANGTELDLEVVATPEPSTLSMLFCAMMVGAGIAWRTRRRTQGAR